MKLPIVDFETAKDLKKLGFDWVCTSSFNIEQALVVKWFRDVHNIHIEIQLTSIGSDEFCYSWTLIYLPNEFKDAKRRNIHYVYKNSYSEYGGTYTGGWDTYEEAELEGIKAAIKYLKENGKQ